MPTYIESRAEALEILNWLDAQLQVIQSLYGQSDSPSLIEQHREFAQQHGEEFMEKLGELREQGSPVYQVMLNEPVLQQRYNAADKQVAFWANQGWIEEEVVEEAEEEEEHDERLFEVPSFPPPEPPCELTGVSVLEYLQQLSNWVRGEAADLWDINEDNPERELMFDLLPQLPQRFVIGEFSQLSAVLQALSEIPKIRQLWLKLSSTGAYWEEVGVGSARAALIQRVSTVIKKILKSPESNGKPSTQSLLSALFDTLTSEHQ